MKTQGAQILVKTKGTWTKVAFLSIFLSHCLVVQGDNDVTFLLQCSSFSCVAQVKQMYMYNHYEQVQLYFLIIIGVMLPQLSISRTPL